MFKTLNLETGEKKEISSDKISHNFHSDIKISQMQKIFVEEHMTYRNHISINIPPHTYGFRLLLSNNEKNIDVNDILDCYIMTITDVRKNVQYTIKDGTLKICERMSNNADIIMATCTSNFFRPKQLIIKIKGKLFNSILIALYAVSAEWEKTNHIREQFKLIIEDNHVYDCLSDTIHRYKHSCPILT